MPGVHVGRLSCDTQGSATYTSVQTRAGSQVRGQHTVVAFLCTRDCQQQWCRGAQTGCQLEGLAASAGWLLCATPTLLVASQTALGTHDDPSPAASKTHLASCMAAVSPKALTLLCLWPAACVHQAPPALPVADALLVEDPHQQPLEGVQGNIPDDGPDRGHRQGRHTCVQGQMLRDACGLRCPTLPVGTGGTSGDTAGW